MTSQYHELDVRKEIQVNGWGTTQLAKRSIDRVAIRHTWVRVPGSSSRKVYAYTQLVRQGSREKKSGSWKIWCCYSWQPLSAELRALSTSILFFFVYYRKIFTPRTAHDLAHLSCIAQAFETCADKLLQLNPGKTCVAHVAPIAHSGPNELARLAPIAHPGKMWADELSSIAQALKTCADELSPIAQAGENMCSSCSSYSSSWAKWASSCSSYSSLGQICVYGLSSIAQALKTCAHGVSPKAQAGKTCADELSPIAQAGETCVAHTAHIAHSGPNELAHVAPIAHPGKICADELYPL